MAKFKFGQGTGQSRLNLLIESYKDSPLEVEVGDRHDMSQTDMRLIEHGASALTDEINRLREEVRALAQVTPPGETQEAVCREALMVADHAGRIVQERRWYSVSAKGLLEAAKAVGEAASPLVASAVKIIELLRKAKG